MGEKLQGYDLSTQACKDLISQIKNPEHNDCVKITAGRRLWDTVPRVSSGYRSVADRGRCFNWGSTEEPFHQYQASWELICGILLSRNGSPVSAEEKCEEPPRWEPYYCLLTGEKEKSWKRKHTRSLAMWKRDLVCYKTVAFCTKICIVVISVH